jgi:hypothetical protein
MNKNSPVKLLLITTFLMVCSSMSVHAKRLALAIGNDSYQVVPKLNKAGNDAEAMGEEFRKAGFEVDVKKNVNYKNMVRSIDSFLAKVKKGDEVVVFYAGHGVQLKTGPYLLPVDIEAENEAEIEKFAYGLYDLTEKINEKKAAFALMILDACRDNPFGSRTRAIGATRGLNAVEPAKGQMVVYSASRGQQALDSLNEKDRNPNGVFTREFISKMRQPGIRVDELVRQVQDSVETMAGRAGHEQRPALYNESRGSFYFYEPLEEVVKNNDGTITSNAEDIFWTDTKAAGNKEAFEAYLNSYPTGKYVNLAKANISKLTGKSAIDNSAARNAIMDEMTLWNESKKKGDKKSFEIYLNKYPSGFFSGLANESLRLLKEEALLAEMESNGSAKDKEKLASTSKLITESRQRIQMEEKASLDLVKALLRIEVPTF